MEKFKTLLKIQYNTAQCSMPNKMRECQRRCIASKIFNNEVQFIKCTNQIIYILAEMKLRKNLVFYRTGFNHNVFCYVYLLIYPAGLPITSLMYFLIGP